MRFPPKVQRSRPKYSMSKVVLRRALQQKAAPHVRISILTRLVAYIVVAIAAGLLFLAGATVYELMWPRPVVPLSQMSNSP
jgi:hypothetical protein